MCTVDCDFMRLKVNKHERDLSKLTSNEKKKMRLRSRKKRDNFREAVTKKNYKTSTFFVTDADIKAMRAPFIKVNSFYFDQYA